MKFIFQKLSELSSKQLFEALKLRQDIFCIEQNCLYPDLDATDHTCIHALALQDNKCVATARIYQDQHQTLHLGRIAVDKNTRSTGLGTTLVQECINYCEKHFSHATIEISAQLHLLGYYNKLGFKELEASYFEDGIPHIKMQFQKN